MCKNSLKQHTLPIALHAQHRTCMLQVLDIIITAGHNCHQLYRTAPDLLIE